MLFNLDNPYEVEKFKTAVSEILSKKGKVELIRKYPPRSMPQNNYLHLLLGYFAKEFGYSTEQVKSDIFKNECNPEIFYRLRTNKYGETITYVRSTSELTSEEMSIAIERFRNYSSAVCGLYLPSPNEDEAVFFAQQQIENHKAY